MMKNAVQFAMLSFCLGSMIACAQTSGPAAAASPKLENDDQKTLYALGLLLGKNIKPFALKPEELAIVKAGLTDAVTDAKPQVEIETYGPKVNELAQKRAAAGAEDAKKKKSDGPKKEDKDAWKKFFDKRVVVTGLADNARVEIVSGLKPGEEVALEDPTVTKDKDEDND